MISFHRSRAPMLILLTFAVSACATQHRADLPSAAIAAPPAVASDIAASDGNESLHRATAAPADYNGAPLGVGWMKAFPYTDGQLWPAPQQAYIVLPEVHESALETAFRKALRERLAQQGYSLTVRESAAPPDALVLSYHVKVVNEFERDPPQSPLRFAPPLSDPLRDDRFGRTAPESVTLDPSYLYWDDYFRKGGDSRSVSVAVYVRRGDERVWGGFAAATIGPAGRTALVKAIAGDIAVHLGDTVNVPQAVFSEGEAPPAGPAD